MSSIWFTEQMKFLGLTIKITSGSLALALICVLLAVTYQMIRPETLPTNCEDYPERAKPEKLPGQYEGDNNDE